MRKQELIHLHALCVEIRAHFEDTHDLPPDAFERYDATDVEHTDVFRRKEAHREALSRLVDDLSAISTTTLDDSSIEPLSAEN